MDRTYTSDYIDISNKWAIRFMKYEQDENERVMFYDKRYAKPDYEGWEVGQPTYSYYVFSIAEHKDGYALCLDGSIESWTVSAEDMLVVTNLCKERL
jgi:hypothetical protein